MIYEIYEVPNLELDNTEEYLAKSDNIDEANKLYDKLAQNGFYPIWIIQCSDENGYEKVIRT